jgi:hypothetical protein
MPGELRIQQLANALLFVGRKPRKLLNDLLEAYFLIPPHLSVKASTNQHRIRCLRADSGFYGDHFLSFLEERALPYVVVIRSDANQSRDRIEDLLLEQIPKILKVQGPAERFFAQHVIGHVGLPNLQLTDFVLDRVADQQSIRKDGLCLADSMGPINGLIFDGWIPPWVKKDHVGCRLQI